MAGSLFFSLYQTLRLLLQKSFQQMMYFCWIQHTRPTKKFDKMIAVLECKTNWQLVGFHSTGQRQEGHTCINAREVMDGTLVYVCNYVPHHWHYHPPGFLDRNSRKFAQISACSSRLINAQSDSDRLKNLAIAR